MSLVVPFSYMKVLPFGENTKVLENIIGKLDLEIVTENPDIVITYGGDGTLLSAEREHPGIPKLPIRNSQFCHKCTEHEDEIVLKKLMDGKLQFKEHKKLHTKIYGKDLYALNDFVVRNELPTHAIRFKIQPPLSSLTDSGAGSINNNLHIGDGIVVSTPFGSTGYFRSVTRESFTEGFGIAFNNTVEKTDPLNLSDQDNVDFELVRGKAILTSDNDPKIFHLSEGTKLTFKLSDKLAKIYEDTSLRCPNCQVIRG